MYQRILILGVKALQGYLIAQLVLNQYDRRKWGTQSAFGVKK